VGSTTTGTKRKDQKKESEGRPANCLDRLESGDKETGGENHKLEEKKKREHGKGEEVRQKGKLEEKEKKKTPVFAFPTSRNKTGTGNGT